MLPGERQARPTVRLPPSPSSLPILSLLLTPTTGQPRTRGRGSRCRPGPGWARSSLAHAKAYRTRVAAPKQTAGPSRSPMSLGDQESPKLRAASQPRSFPTGLVLFQVTPVKDPTESSSCRQQMFALGQFELSICHGAAAIRATLSPADGNKPEEKVCLWVLGFVVVVVQGCVYTQSAPGARFSPPHDDSGANTRVSRRQPRCGGTWFGDKTTRYAIYLKIRFSAIPRRGKTTSDRCTHPHLPAAGSGARQPLERGSADPGGQRGARVG